jgi:hypothetical protein
MEARASLKEKNKTTQPSYLQSFTVVGIKLFVKRQYKIEILCDWNDKS